MANAGIVYTFSDGDELRCWVEVDASYPDAIDEARKQALTLYRDALGVSVEGLAGEDEA